MGETNIQWHPAFVSAMQLEFREDRGKLFFEKEHNLNTKPLQIDLLVIRKEGSWDIGNEIGKLFRKYNIIEYKSPKQHLDIDVFYKAESYAGLYKAYGETVDGRKAGEITVSIVRDGKPKGLFQYFAEHGIRVEKHYPGIYYVMDKVPFPTQVIVTEELAGEHHAWLKSLSDKTGEADMRMLLQNASCLKEKLDKDFAESVLEVCLRANAQVLEKLKGDDIMSEALLEIVEPIIKPLLDERQRVFEMKITKEVEAKVAKEVEAKVAKEVEAKVAKEVEAKVAKEVEAKVKAAEAKAKAAEAKAKEEGIKSTIILLRNLGHDDSVIKPAIMQQYQLYPEDADKYL